MLTYYSLCRCRLKVTAWVYSPLLPDSTVLLTALQRSLRYHGRQNSTSYSTASPPVVTMADRTVHLSYHGRQNSTYYSTASLPVVTMADSKALLTAPRLPPFSKNDVAQRPDLSRVFAIFIGSQRVNSWCLGSQPKHVSNQLYCRELRFAPAL